MYAKKTDGHRAKVRKQCHSRVLRIMNLNGWQAVIVQSETVTEEDWRGLSQADAESLCVASETSVLGGKTRNYLGGCTVSSGLSSMWATECWGTRVTSQMQRMGDTNLYQVTKTTTVFDVSAPSGNLSKW